MSEKSENYAYAIQRLNELETENQRLKSLLLKWWNKSDMAETAMEYEIDYDGLVREVRDE